MSNLSVTIGADTSGFTRAVDNAIDLLHIYEDAAKKATRVSNDNGAVTRSQIASYQRVVNALDKVTRGTMNSTQQQKALTTQIRELKIQWENLSNEARKSDFGHSMSQSMRAAESQLKTLTSQIDRSKGKINDASKTNGKYSNSTNDMSGALTQLTNKFGINITKLSAWGAAAGAAAAAGKVLADAFKRSEENCDLLDKSILEVKTVYNSFLDTIAAGGTWGNFFSNLQTSIKMASELYDAIDRLGSIKQNNAAAIAIQRQAIAELRRRKQEETDEKKKKAIDDQIIAAEKNLYSLQNQTVTAGKKAGVSGIKTELSSRANSYIDNLKVPAALLSKAATNIVKGGQEYIDQQTEIYKKLEKKISYNTITIHDHGQTVTSKLPDYSGMTNQEKLAYSVARAVTESEGSIGEYVATFAEAVQGGMSAEQERFRANRYAGMGNGMGKGESGGSTKGGKAEFKEATFKSVDNFKINDEPLKAYIKSPELNTSGAGNALSGFNPSMTYEGILESGEWTDWGLEDRLQLLEDLNSAIQDLSTQMTVANTEEQNQIKEKIALYGELRDAVDQQSESVKMQSNLSKAASGLNSLGDAFANMSAMSEKGNKDLDTASIIAGAIAKVIEGYSIASAESATMGPFGWAAFSLTGLAQVTSVIQQLHAISKKKYAHGGIIHGGSMVGDYNLARVNDGEMIINGTQQSRLFHILNGSSFNESRLQPSTVEFRIKGKNLVGTERNYYNRRNRI